MTSGSAQTTRMTCDLATILSSLLLPLPLPIPMSIPFLPFPAQDGVPIFNDVLSIFAIDGQGPFLL